jgi:hypothetical protein
MAVDDVDSFPHPKNSSSTRILPNPAIPGITLEFFDLPTRERWANFFWRIVYMP